MGEIEISGPDARAFVQYVVTNDVNRLGDQDAMYTLMTDDRGGIVDDLLVYQLAPELYWLVVNASNIAADLAWVQSHAEGFQVTIRDLSDETALLAVQGPAAAEMVEQLTNRSLQDVRPFSFVRGHIDGEGAILSRTGYTGEDGFEIYLPSASAAKVFDRLIALGAEPCGLGARDTLRLEARLPLYGNDLRRDVTPLEAGLGMFVKLDKGDFVGRAALAAQKESGVPRKLVGLESVGRGIARTGYPVFRGDQQVGEVTSGTMSPTLQKPIALALVDSDCASIGETLEVEIRGKRHPMTVVKTPFYKRNLVKRGVNH
jgi:aminomethyltransferase